MKTFIAACTLTALAGVAPSMAAESLPVNSSGETSIPALKMPSSSLASKEGNNSRVEHILSERALKSQGKTTDQINAALFGPRLERMLAAVPS